LLVFLGNVFNFGKNADEIDFPAGSANWPLVNADDRLNKILLKAKRRTAHAGVPIG
jgi:hypothetical protein